MMTLAHSTDNPKIKVLEPPKCDHPMQYGSCNHDAGHRGRHTTQAWRCDGCGKTRRGTAHYSYEPDGGSLQFCFMCVRGKA